MTWTPPPTLVEELAKAIYDQGASDIDSAPLWRMVAPHVQYVYRDQARAIIPIIARVVEEELKAIADPDKLLCCTGYHCGCHGATVGQYAAWLMQSGDEE